MNEDLEFTGGQSGAESMLSAIQDRERQYTEEELYKDLDWIEASGKLYEMNEGKKFDGDYQSLAKYGIDQMSQFNYNVSLGMIPDVMAVEKADHETQIAFAYLMDTYDKKDVTLAGVGRAFKELALDPTSYIGIGTLGAGFAVKQGAKTAAKEGLKNRLHNSIRTYLSSGVAVGATEGALYTAGDEMARQSIKQDAGLQEGYDVGAIGAHGALGAVAGGALVKGAEVLGTQLGKGIDYINKQGEEAMAQVAGGGTPPAQPFYSVAQEAIDKMPNKMNSADFIKYLKGKGVKDDEIQYSGINDAIQGKGSITKQEAMEALSNPQLDVVTKQSAVTTKTVDQYMAEIRQAERRGDWDTSERLTQEMEEVELGGGVGDTKYQKYSTPNVGSNYREELTTIKPELKKGFSVESVEDNGVIKYYVEEQGESINKYPRVYNTKEEAQSALKKHASQGTKYKSSHWDEPNVLYHTRKQDTDIDGDKTLLIEEIQSDWHQEGRKQGYRQKPSERDKEIYDYEMSLKIDNFQERKKAVMEKFGITEQESIEAFKRVSAATGVPQAPYSKTWHEKALKDQIAEAVSKGYDRVAWVTGKTSADRYSLATQVGEVSAELGNDGLYRLTTRDKDGRLQQSAGGLMEKDLPDYVGKEFAQKVVDDLTAHHAKLEAIGAKVEELTSIEPRTPELQDQINKLGDEWNDLYDSNAGGKTYSGLDLEVGGEGMKGFYDKILPDFASKYIKKYGSKVEKKKLKNGDEVWSFEVTPEMKKEVSGKGQALYSVGAGATGVAVSQSQDKDNK